MKVGEPITGSAGPETGTVGSATEPPVVGGKATVVVVTGGAVVVVGATVVVVTGGAVVVVVVVVVATGSHWAYRVSVPEFGNVYVLPPA